MNSPVIAELFVRGELWRGVTSHLLHAVPAFPIHLGINLLGLLALGHLVERPLGSARTAIVLGLGAVGSTVGVLLYDYPEVLGASGLVAALAGGSEARVRGVQVHSEAVESAHAGQRVALNLAGIEVPSQVDGKPFLGKGVSMAELIRESIDFYRSHLEKSRLLISQKKKALTAVGSFTSKSKS